MIAKFLSQYITNVPGFPKPGIQFKDITTLLEQPGYLKAVAIAMDQAVPQDSYDKIVCADARGFIFGSALSSLNGKPVILARKPGKLPRPGTRVSFDLEYGQASLEVSAGSINSGDRCIIVDDLLATGGTAEAMHKIIARDGGLLIKYVVLIELMDLCGRHNVTGADVVSLVKYGVAPGETVIANLEGIVDEDQLRYDGLSELKVKHVNSDQVLCDWKLEDRVVEKAIPFTHIKYVIGADGHQRDFIE